MRLSSSLSSSTILAAAWLLLLQATSVAAQGTLAFKPFDHSARVGQDLRIAWNSDGTGTVTLELIDAATKGLKVVKTIFAQWPNGGVYLWTIPDSIPNGSDYALKIIADDTTTLYSTFSDIFSITGGGSSSAENTTSSSSSATTSTSPTTAPSSSSNTSSPSSSSSSLSPGAIAGIVIGTIALFGALTAAFIFLMMYRRKRPNTHHKEEQGQDSPSSTELAAASPGTAGGIGGGTEEESEKRMSAQEVSGEGSRYEVSGLTGPREVSEVDGAGGVHELGVGEGVEKSSSGAAAAAGGGKRTAYSSGKSEDGYPGVPGFSSGTDTAESARGYRRQEMP